MTGVFSYKISQVLFIFLTDFYSIPIYSNVVIDGVGQAAASSANSQTTLGDTTTKTT
jgi:hypothetical protein